MFFIVYNFGSNVPDSPFLKIPFTQGFFPLNLTLFLLGIWFIQRGYETADKRGE